ncbi:efflux RND transporter periplasmic adaptor subunit [Hyalangium versicolor]|uniref:efflux RND transporter periplasmic adaptor subunit n=1 Tax=Hyalangium versicolor TaxID=2861190 RepID=UPI001CCBB21A|nr:efflux RND transporter periplasmic adaptor subunit [Hyalangium versicolor]
MSQQDAPQPLFRQEALAHHARPEARGSLLQITPFWARTTYWIIVLAAVVAGVGLAVVDINEYAQGSVLIQVKGLEDVASTAGGRVSRVLVQRGQHVKAGETLVELYSSQELGDRERLEQEFRALLATTLLTPLNGAAQQVVSSMRTQLDQSQARLAERSLKAPFEGIVNDVRVREGQFIGQGEVVVSVMREGAESWALGLVPGRYRPMIKPGQAFRLELEGFPYQFRDLEVASISDELVGPAEVRRYLGPDLGDVVTLQGPVVVVEARLPSSEFVSDKRTYHYYTGMPGTVRVKVRSRNGWMTLLPILDYLRGDRG